MELKNYFAQNAAGDILPDAQAYLYLPGTTTLVSGLLTAAGTAQGNPVAATAQGLLQFAAPNGVYDLRITAPGREYTLRIQCNDVAESVTAAQLAATHAQASSQIAADAAELAKLERLYATYADAYAAVWTLPEGVIVRVLADETRNGRSSWYRTNTPPGPSLSLDFGLGSYAQAEPPLTFIKSDDLRQVAVPATATAIGSVGDYALDAAHLYLAVASNVWKRVALSEF